jgi:hypothetical protein
MLRFTCPVDGALCATLADGNLSLMGNVTVVGNLGVDDIKSCLKCTDHDVLLKCD